MWEVVSIYFALLEEYLNGWGSMTRTAVYRIE